MKKSCGENTISLAAVQLSNGPSHPSDDRHATWSPDGRLIAFTSNRNGAHDLWVMDDDGGNQRKLADHPHGIRHPAWSPNGRWFAFTSHDPNQAQNQALWVMDSDGGNQRNLTDNHVRNQYPVWTPDSRHILFTSEMLGTKEVFAIDVDTRNLINLTNNPAIEQFPGVSPDGRFVAFTSDRDGGTSQIWVTDMNGGSPRNLSNGAGVGDYFPDWTARVSTLTVSPAGRTVTTWGWIKLPVEAAR